MTPIFYRGAHGAIITFDVTNRESFNRATKWFHEMKEFAEGNPRMILVGNKIDLKNREISNEEATNLARQFDCKFYEVSAYLGTNVDVIFNDLAKEIYQQRKRDKHDKRELKIGYDSNGNDDNQNPRNKKLTLNIVNNPDNDAFTTKRKGGCC
jgi:GTPase SAR1 family protein